MTAAFEPNIDRDAREAARERWPQFECPRCGAPAERHCRTSSGVTCPPHAERLARAERETGHRVACDENCAAVQDPKTLGEFKDAYRHWRYHEVRGGCSHDR